MLLLLCAGRGGHVDILVKIEPAVGGRERVWGRLLCLVAFVRQGLCATAEFALYLGEEELAPLDGDRRGVEAVCPEGGLAWAADDGGVC